METTFIYTLIDPNTNEIRYIGKSNTPRKRLYDHINECNTNKKSHKISWIKTLLDKGKRPTIEIIDEIYTTEWEFWEQYWISQFKTWGFNLTNITAGGAGCKYKRTCDTKQKMRKAKLGRKQSITQRYNKSISVRKYAAENPNYNKSSDKHHIISKEDLYKKYIVENLSLNKCASYFNTSKYTIFRNITEFGFQKDTEQWKEQLISNPKKIVLQYDFNDKLIKEWFGLKSIQEELGLNKSNVAHCCKGETKSCGGFIWKYK